ncbi:deoxyribose-phosphate aldolase [Halorussus litoreus]|uniref:deoxyribose-phosphate aldolase n=1 Tax=Halorussus litoreus TaxID=1710536 RepID=UPI000E279BA2|nr:deoxyribose-phosphate aldolase [Halorussus litoreus]
MDEAELAAAIDHTILGGATRWENVRRVMDEAADYGMNACIPPCYVADAAEYARSAADAASTDRPEGDASDVTLATVIGFPHGHHHTEIKRREAELAHEDGADELDMVMNAGRLKSGDEEFVLEDIEAVVDATPLPVKVILETANLKHTEKKRACELAVEAGAEFVKTSTGFADGGATLFDVRFMNTFDIKVKASGGIGSYSMAKQFLDIGADRIGASRGVKIMEQFREMQGKEPKRDTVRAGRRVY